MEDKVAEYVSKDGTEKIVVRYSKFADDPREWREYKSEMVIFHRKYSLGDQDIDSRFDIDNYSSFDEMIDDNVDEGDAILELYLYDHGGITLKSSPFSCPWDSGKVGFILLRAEHIESMFPNDPDAMKKAEALLEKEVRDYDMYIRGENYVLETYNREMCDHCGSENMESDDYYHFTGEWEIELQEFFPDFSDRFGEIK